MNIVLTPDGPLDTRGTLARYHLWGEDPTNRITSDGDVFRRVLRHGGRLLPYQVRWSGPLDDVRITIRGQGDGADVGGGLLAQDRPLLGRELHLDRFSLIGPDDPA